MNKIQKILLGSGATLLGASILRWLYVNAELAKQWDYEVGNIRAFQFTPPNYRAAFDLVIKNKSAFSATVRDIDIHVMTGGKTLTVIKMSDEVTIQPDGNTPISISFSVNMKDIFGNYEAIGRALLSQYVSKKDVDLDFVGQMRVKTVFGWTKVPIRFSNTGKNLYKLYKETYS